MTESGPFLSPGTCALCWGTDEDHWLGRVGAVHSELTLAGSQRHLSQFGRDLKAEEQASFTERVSGLPRERLLAGEAGGRWGG